MDEDQRPAEDQTERPWDGQPTRKRVSTPTPTPTAKPQQQVSPWFWIAIVTAIVLMMIFLRDSDPAGDDGTGGTSRREDCEYQWELNRDTAESPYMDRQLYVENCLETARDLEDGTFDGR